MSVLTNQYWGSPTQRMTFTPDGGSTYTVVHNPTAYNNVGNSQAEIELPAQVGISAIIGGVEYAPQAITFEWDEMDSSEYAYLGSISFKPCVMVDMEDNGWYGYLRMVGFEYIVAASTKVGKVTALFMAIAPANGQRSTINAISSPDPAHITVTVANGGSIGGTSDITIQYALAFKSVWGETLITPFSATVPGHTPPHTDYVQIGWNAPNTSYYRLARLYISTNNSAPLAPGDTAYLLGDTLWAQTQQWTDYNGNVNGATFPKIVIPSSSTAYKGYFGGGRWTNDT